MLITKTVTLNILQLTDTKKKMLMNLEQKWLEGSNHCFETLRYWDAIAPDMPLTRYNLQHFEYKHIKKFTGLQSQLVVDLFKDVFAIWKNNKAGNINNASISYNIPRSGNLKYTERGNPIAIVRTLDKRIGLPISQDGTWYRFKQFVKDGWKFTAFNLKRYGDCWKVLISIKKVFTIRKRYDTVIGIDIGSRTLVALSIINKEGKILKQLYFGRDIWNRQRDISIRRSKLNSLADKGDRKAKRKLEKMSKDESNFVKTRCYEIAHQVINLTKKYNAYIAIEDLKGLSSSRLNRKANRKVKRMPYYRFGVALQQIARQNNTAVISINPAYTSQICSRCGNIYKTNNVLYKCPCCGFTCNRDRNASVNIALVAGLFSISIVKNPQTSKRYASVNRHAWKYDGVLGCLQHNTHSPNFKPTTLVVGS